MGQKGYYPCKLEYVVDLIDIIKCQNNDTLIRQIEEALS